MGDTTTIAPGVTRTECWWGYYLEGGKDAIVTAGLADESWFADWRQRDRAGRTVRSKRLVDQGRLIETTRPARGLCMVQVIRDCCRFFHQVDPKCEHFLRDLLTTTAAANWANKAQRTEVDELYRPGPARG